MQVAALAEDALEGTPIERSKESYVVMLYLSGHRGHDPYPYSYRSIKLAS